MEIIMTRFSGKTVLVTGAASGMGRAAARRFSDEGANVVVLDLDRAALEKASTELAQDRLLIQPGNTTDMAAASAAVKAAVDRFGGLDVLINNAGIFCAGTITETSEEDF
jgi:meso-butanediol dehydrogenase/(S,S)-butanediol dehydrogenase/diacetyl reductase